MANVDGPFGFLPVEDESGGHFSTRVYIKAAADGVVLGINDLVDVTGAADTIARGAAGGPFVGSNRAFGAASTLTSHPVLKLLPSTVCVAQEDSVGGAIAAASEALNADVIVADASTTTGLSAMEIDSNTAATTSTLDLRLLRPYPSPDNTVAVANAKWLVKVNDLREHDLKAGV